MSDMPIGFNPIQSLPSTTNIQKKEPLISDKTKEEVKTFVAENKTVLESSLLLATAGTAIKIKENVPFVDNAIKSIAKNGSIVAGTTLGLASGFLITDGVKNIKKGELTKGLVEVNLAAGGVLGSFQLVARAANITSLKNVFSSNGGQSLLAFGAGASLMVDGVNRMNRAYDGERDFKGFVNLMAGSGETVVGGLIAGMVLTK